MRDDRQRSRLLISYGIPRNAQRYAKAKEKSLTINAALATIKKYHPGIMSNRVKESQYPISRKDKTSVGGGSCDGSGSAQRTKNNGNEMKSEGSLPTAL
jgi:hypothetical protein